MLCSSTWSCMRVRIRCATRCLLGSALRGALVHRVPLHRSELKPRAPQASMAPIIIRPRLRHGAPPTAGVALRVMACLTQRRVQC